MKILVTGGYGFIGSFLVEKLHQEGHQLFIIDNLSSGQARNVSCKHRFYQLGVEDVKCEELFKNNHFELILHLAGGVIEQAGLSTETGVNARGLVNMLNLAVKYGTKKFIFISTAEIYGNTKNLPLQEVASANPVSCYGISKLAGELYCRRWSEIHGLPLLILRLSSVYGPRQKWANDEKGLINGLIHGAGICLDGDAKYTRDYIFIADVVEAVYQAIKNDISGILNLASNQETSYAQLTELIQKKTPSGGTLSFSGKNGTAPRICLDNSKIRKSLNWEPRYSLEAGVTETIEWLKKEPVDPQEETAGTVKRTNKWKHFIRLPYVENGIAFFLTCVLTEMTKYNSDYHMLDVKLIYILMMGIMYGMVQSLVAVILSIGLFIFTALSTGRDFISLINDPINIVQIILYSMVGLYIGYTTERKNREILIKDRRLQELEAKITFVSEINEDARQVTDGLQDQILNFEDSYGKIFNMTRELDSLEPEKIYNAAVLLVENVMKSDSVSIYFVNQNATYMRLIVKSKKLEAVKSLITKERPEIQAVLTTRDLAVNKSLHAGVPMLLAPIMDGDRVVAIVGLHHVEFEKLTLYYQNLFKVVIGLISSSLTKAFRYKEAIGQKGSALGIPILNREDFRRMVNLKREAKNRTGVDYSILRIYDLDMHNAVKLHQLAESVREVDYIGYSKDGVAILLSNTNLLEAQLTMARLKKKQISTAVIPDEGGKG